MRIFPAVLFASLAGQSVFASAIDHGVCTTAFPASSMTIDAREQLAHKLELVDAGHDDVQFTDPEVDWAAAEISALIARLESGQERVYLVGGYNWKPGTRKDLDKGELEDSLKQLKARDFHSLAYSRTRDWIVHRLVRPPETEIEHLRAAGSFAELRKTLTLGCKWTLTSTPDGELIEFSNGVYTPKVVVKVGEYLSIKDRASLAESVGAGRGFISGAASRQMVKYMPDSNDWGKLKTAGFEPKNDERLRLVTFINKANGGRITLPLVFVGELSTQYTANDQANFLRVSLNGGDYVHPSVAERLPYIGKPTPDEWTLMKSVRHQGDVETLLRKMNWTLKVEKGFSIFTNPVFGNSIRFPDLATGSIFPGVSATQLQSIQDAIQSHSDYPSTSPAADR